IVEVVNDDMPFLVDSVTAELNRRGYTVHLVIHPIMPVRRDQGRFVGIGGGDAAAESLMRFEIDEVTDPVALGELRAGVERVLADVRAAVSDWRPMRDRLRETVAGFAESPPPVPADEVEEAAAFLNWLDENNFTFLGCRDYAFEGEGEALQAVPMLDTSLGILRSERVEPAD